MEIWEEKERDDWEGLSGKERERGDRWKRKMDGKVEQRKRIEGRGGKGNKRRNEEMGGGFGGKENEEGKGRKISNIGKGREEWKRKRRLGEKESIV